MPTITFTKPINISTQVGDTIYSAPVVNSPGINPFGTVDMSTINVVGEITDISSHTITYNLSGSNPGIGDYIMFSKDNAVNISKLKGYYMSVTMSNNSNSPVELFSIGSEVSESSK